MLSSSLFIKTGGKKIDCSIYSSIFLLSIAGKILAHVLLNIITPAIVEGCAPESQCGLRLNTGITNMIFILKQSQGKSQERNKGFYIAFIVLHNSWTGQVTWDGSLSENFPASNIVKEGFTIASTLFSIFHSTMLHESKKDLLHVLYIQFQTDFRMFNLQ